MLNTEFSNKIKQFTEKLGNQLKAEGRLCVIRTNISMFACDVTISDMRSNKQQTYTISYDPATKTADYMLVYYAN